MAEETKPNLQDILERIRSILMASSKPFVEVVPCVQVIDSLIIQAKNQEKEIVNAPEKS